MSLSNIRENQRGFGLFTVIVIGILAWGAWVTLSSIRSDESPANPDTMESADESESKVENTLEQISLKPRNGFSSGGSVTRQYNRFDGFELRVSAVLPALPPEVHYEGYYKGTRGTIRLGRMDREVSTYTAEYASFSDDRIGYDTVEIRVEGAEGKVEGIAVPFTAAEGRFDSQ